MRNKRRRVVSSSSEDDAASPKRATRSQPSGSQTGNADDKSIRAGGILRITLKNFMCHSHLEVELSSNVNFLTGNNGSGKSAILAALALGLGSKARTTARGNIGNIKAFVKFGKNSGSIEIVLNNKGAKAFKPEVYGTKIIINRTITTAGSSSYRMKDENGKVVSTKTKDLKELTNALNLQVDNPVCILSQDTARNFLNATDPKIRFDLYYRATRIDQLALRYQESVKNKSAALHLFNEQKEKETNFIRQAKRLQKKIDEAKRIETMTDSMGALENELAWANIIANEREYEQQTNTVNEVANELEGLQEQYEKERAEVDSAQEKKLQLAAQLQTFQESHNTSNKPLEELQAKMRSIEKQISAKSSSVESMERQINFRQQDLQGLLKELRSFDERASQLEKQKQSKAEKIVVYERQKKEKQNLLINYEDDIAKLTAHVKEKEAHHNSAKLQLHACDSKINTLSEKLSTLRKETNNPLAIYGPNYVRLMQAIKSDEQNFTRPPIGPLGAFISVKNKKWTLAAETQLGANLLGSFLVNTQQDQNRLNQIIKRVWPREGGGRAPAIIATKFMDRLYDVSKNVVECYESCERLYDVLTVQDANVMNCIVDQTRLESVLLVPEKALAFKLMKQQRNVPRNCLRAITPQGDIIFPDPNYKVYAGRAERARYIQVDCADAAHQVELALAREREAKAELQATVRALAAEVARAGVEMPTLNRQALACRDDINLIAQKLLQLHSERFEALGNMDDLKHEVGEIEKTIQQKSASVRSVQVEIEDLQAQLDELQGEYREANEARGKMAQEKEELTAAVNDHNYHMQDLVNKCARSKKRYHELKTKAKEESQTLETLKATWQQVAASTEEKSGLRPENIRRTAIIQEEVNKLQVLVLQLKKLNLNELNGRLEALQESINSNHESMNEIEESLIELEGIKTDRKEKLKETKEYVKNYAIYSFSTFLQCRNYQGNMSIDYDKETLDICVIPHTGSQGVTPATNLSGGERSFSTVAFLYSLWKTLDFPFYFLDEFDVYMDPQNRNLVIKMLIDHAKRNPDAQYVFLTPQNISFINDSEVSIRRLADPERLALTQ